MHNLQKRIRFEMDEKRTTSVTDFLSKFIQIMGIPNGSLCAEANN
jgi:hypothetical protein